jgi:hypothetical protein
LSAKICFVKEWEAEMGPDLTLQLILQHFSVALIPWLIMMPAGAGLGYALAGLIRRQISAHTWILKTLVFLPWRAVAIWIALVDINSFLLIWWLGLGILSASVTVAIALGLLITPLVTLTLLQAWYPPSLSERIMSVARTSAVFSIALVVILLTSGMGYYINQVSAALDIQKMIIAYGVVAAMLLGVDILFGMIQAALLTTQSRSASS